MYNILQKGDHCSVDIRLLYKPLGGMQFLALMLGLAMGPDLANGVFLDVIRAEA